MEQQEYFMRMQMLGQEAEKIEQQIQAIDQQISELGAIRESLDILNSKTDKNREILANLGKGIFVKADLKDKELFVNVGNEIIIKKTPAETIKVIDEQTKRMLAGKEQFVERIAELQANMQNLLAEMQSGQASSGEHSHGHGCGAECEHEDCECEEPCEDCECEHSHVEEKKKGKKR